MEKIKVTIITASYNAKKTIEQTISSVVHQDYPNIEYIVVDGGSTDGTVEIIKKYEPYGVKWISEPDQGLYDALNKGLQLATGDYVEIIGADDSLTRADIISRVVSEMEPDTDILCGQEWLVDEAQKTQIPYTNTIARNKSTYYGGMIPHAAMFVRRSLFHRYPFDTGYRITGDYKFFLQCYYDESVRIQYSDTMVVFFSISGMSSRIEACWAEDNRIYQDLKIPFHSPDYSHLPFLIRWLKKGLVVFRLFIPVRKMWHFVRTRILWKRHTCTNKICRWCERMERD